VAPQGLKTRKVLARISPTCWTKRKTRKKNWLTRSGKTTFQGKRETLLEVDVCNGQVSVGKRTRYMTDPATRDFQDEVNEPNKHSHLHFNIKPRSHQAKLGVRTTMMPGKHRSKEENPQVTFSPLEPRSGLLWTAPSITSSPHNARATSSCIYLNR
jgi:hypothetical protein